MRKEEMTAVPEPLSTGIALIDNEHAYLLTLLERLRTLCVRTEEPCHTCTREQLSQCDGALTALFAEVLDYMVGHFRSEEALMLQHQLPAAFRHAHAEEHANIGQRLQSLISRSPHQIVVKPAEFYHTLHAWLEDHIKNADMQIVDYLRPAPVTGY
jgi:hemerythrin-like metal-binding protein